jgi:D-3-phosphoglycerate dehydrogenase
VSPTILIMQPIPEAAVDWLRAQGAEVLLGWEDDWRSRAGDVRALVYYSIRVDRELLDALPALEVVGKRGAGVDTVDLEETERRGIRVTNIVGADGNANTVAEHAITLLFAATRAIPAADRFTRAGRFRERMSLPLVEEISRSRVGIVGVGQIGGRIASMLGGGFQCELGAYDPYLLAERAAELAVRRFETVRELVEWADNLVVAAPLTPETRGLVGAGELRLLGPNGVVVVSSRGGIVDERALADAVRDGTIRGAGVDVYDPEPPEPDNPLFELDRVVLTPHVAGASRTSRERTSLMVCQQVWSLLHGGTAPLVGGQPWLERV